MIVRGQLHICITFCITLTLPSSTDLGIHPPPLDPKLPYCPKPQRVPVPDRKRRWQNTGKDYFSNDAGTHMSTRIEALRLIETITDDLTGNSGIFSTTQQSKPTGSATDTHGPATTTGDTTSPRSGTDLCQFMQTSPSGNPGNRRASLGGDNLHNVYRSDSVVTRKVTGYPPSHQSTSVPTSNWFAALSVLTQSPNGDELADTRHDSQSHTVDHQHSPIPRAKTPSPTTMHSGSSHSQSTNSELPQKFANLTIHTDNSNRRTVQFQENPTPKPVLPPAAAAMWRQSRSSLQTSVKASIRSEWLQNLYASEVVTPWAAGIAPLPPIASRTRTSAATLQTFARGRPSTFRPKRRPTFKKKPSVRKRLVHLYW